MEESPSTILVADDHPLFRAALVQAVQGLFPAASILEAETAAGVYDAMERCADIDLCLLDLNMPGAYGFSTLIFLRGEYPSVPVVVVSGLEDEDVIAKSMAHQASGYIPKSLPRDTMQAAIMTVWQGEQWLPEGVNLSAVQSSDEEKQLADAITALTPQQFRVLTMVADGLLNKQIAYEMDVKESTVKAHMTEILRKLGVSNRTAAVIACQKLDVRKPVLES